MLDCIVSIRFDLDLGPTVDNVLPEGKLSAEERQTLARIAFPDTAPDNGRSFIYFFTVPCIPSRPAYQQDSSATVPNTYGVGYFRQKRDPACPRGYVQQALLFLTPFPYFTLLDRLMAIVAPIFGQCCLQSPDSTSAPPLPPSRPFLIGAQAAAGSSIEAGRQQEMEEPQCGLDTSGLTQEELLSIVWKDVCSWQSPTAKCRTSLNLLGVSLSFTPPPRSHASVHLRDDKSTDTSIVSSPTSISSPRGHSPCVSSWTPDVPPSLQSLPLVSSGLLTLENCGTWIRLWEMNLAGEPIVVVGSDPTLSSATVLAIESLLLPLRHPPQFNLVRPFVTIQDPATAAYTAIAHGTGGGLVGGVGVVLGVTNPFFLKTFKGFGCVVTILDEGDGSGAADRVSLMLKGSTHKKHQRADVAWASSGIPALTLGMSLTPRVHGYAEVASGCCSPRTVDSEDRAYKCVTSVSGQAAVLITRLRTMETIHAKQQASADVRRESNPVLMSGLRSCNLVRQPSILDDTARKFFESLTEEFLVPLRAWFDAVVLSLQPFAVCCPRTAERELSASVFMKQLSLNRAAKRKPPLFAHRRFAEYEPLYRRFVHGPLFESWRDGSIRAHVETEVNRLAFTSTTTDALHMHPDSPMLRVESSPLFARQFSNEESTDTFINLYNYAARELAIYLDPDTKFVLDCCVVLKIIVGMCEGGAQCELFHSKIDRLQSQAKER